MITQIAIRFCRAAGSRVAVGLMAGGLTLLTAAGAAHAGSWAQVSGDGTVAKSRGVLSNFHDGAGSYRIVFKRSLAKCVVMVTGRDERQFNAYETGSPGEVKIYAINLSNNFADGSFYIALVC